MIRSRLRQSDRGGVPTLPQFLDSDDEGSVNASGGEIDPPAPLAAVRNDTSQTDPAAARPARRLDLVLLRQTSRSSPTRLQQQASAASTRKKIVAEAVSSAKAGTGKEDAADARRPFGLRKTPSISLLSTRGRGRCLTPPRTPPSGGGAKRAQQPSTPPTAGLSPRTPFDSTPFGSTPFDCTPIGSTPFDRTQFDGTPFDNTPFDRTPFDGAPFDSVDDYLLTSSEQDPSSFQVEIPSKKEVLAHSRICALMDGYTAIHRDFDFAKLSSVSRARLKGEYSRSTPEEPMIAGSCHRDVVKQLLDCANDLIVRGFFREYSYRVDERDSERVEACILSSESLRQIIVCFRGSTLNQARPLGKGSVFGKQASCALDEDQKVLILQDFRGAYFGSVLERKVFTRLASLIAGMPFFDVAMTGHSFGAAMATIASLRYALSNPQIRVSCHVFGSPKVGSEEWRQLVHSVPNLRVYRVESCSDLSVIMPSQGEWVHCGHAIQVISGKSGVDFMANLFDRGTSSKSVRAKAMSKNLVRRLSQGRAGHEIHSYVKSLSLSGAKWFEDFCDLKGEGVSGADNERRMMA